MKQITTYTTHAQKHLKICTVTSIMPLVGN